MSADFLRIIPVGESLPTDLVPSLIDERGTVEFGEDEGLIHSWYTRGDMTHYRPKESGEDRLAALEKVAQYWTLTDQRLAVACTGFEKAGGHWFGVGAVGGAIALSGNAIGHLRAKRRGRGKALGGQLPLTSITKVAYGHRGSTSSYGASHITVEYLDGTEPGQPDIYGVRSFMSGAPETVLKQLADLISTWALTARTLDTSALSEAELAVVEARGLLPGIDPNLGRDEPAVVLPGATPRAEDWTLDLETSDEAD